jgi:hypothetical protein
VAGSGAYAMAVSPFVSAAALECPGRHRIAGRWLRGRQTAMRQPWFFVSRAYTGDCLNKAIIIALTAEIFAVIVFCTENDLVRQDDHTRKTSRSPMASPNQSSLCDEGAQEESHKALFADATTGSCRVLRYPVSHLSLRLSGVRGATCSK